MLLEQQHSRSCGQQQPTTRGDSENPAPNLTSSQTAGCKQTSQQKGPSLQTGPILQMELLLEAAHSTATHLSCTAPPLLWGLVMPG